MKYFGTNLNEAGHYVWDIDNGLFFSNRTLKFNDLPFHPENLTNNLSNGDIVFYQGGGYTVLGIAGSCYDKRPNSKSIFWVEEIITKEQMIERIKVHPIAEKIINAMPFKVKW
jgi:hypothetical protein